MLLPRRTDALQGLSDRRRPRIDHPRRPHRRRRRRAGPVRRPRPFSPSQAKAEAVAIAERACGRVAGRPGSTFYAFKTGAYESLYGELYQHYLDAVAEAERYRRGYYPFFSDEIEIPDAAEFASIES